MHHNVHNPFRGKLESADADDDDGERTNDRDESMDVMPSVASLCHCSAHSGGRLLDPFQGHPLLHGFLSSVTLLVFWRKARDFALLAK